MFDRDQWQEIYAFAKRHKLRTLLTAFGVFWGIFMFIFLLGIGRGIETGVFNQFSRRAVNSLYVGAYKTSLPYKGLKPGRFVLFTNEDTQALKDQVQEIESLVPRLRLGGENIVARNRKNGSFNIFGDFDTYPQTQTVDMVDGRFINPLDIQERRKVAVVGPRVVELLFDMHENPLGQTISINGVIFKIVGRFGVDTAMSSQEETQNIHIPFSTMQQTFNLRHVGWYALTVKEQYAVSEVESKIRALLAQRHTIAPEDRAPIRTYDASKEFHQLRNLFQGIHLFLWLVSIGTILAGIVGVSNIMLIIVKERTREIGLRKAIGAPPGSIISMIVQESITLTSLAGYAGLVCGVAVIELLRYAMTALKIENAYFKNPEVNLQTAVTALVLLTLAGTLAGLFPALKAAKINPVEALRAE